MAHDKKVPTLEDLCTMFTWTENPAEVEILRKDNIQFEVRKLTLGDVSFEMSLKLQSRVGDRVKPKNVTSYATAMMAGALFFMPVVNLEPGKRKHVVLSGVNRLLGLDQNVNSQQDAWFMAIVCKVTDPIMLTTLPIQFNGLNGDREDETAMAHHIEMIKNKHDLSPAEIASRLPGVSINTVRNVLGAADVRQRLYNAGVRPEWSVSGFNKMTTIDKSNVLIFTETAKLLHKFDITPTSTTGSTILDEVKRAAQDKGKEAVLKAWEAKLTQIASTAANKSINNTRPNRSCFMKHIRGMHKLREKIDKVSKLQFLAEDTKDAKAMCADVHRWWIQMGLLEDHQ